MTPRHTLLAAALAAAFASAHAADLQLDQARQPLASSLQQLARQAGITLIVDSSLLVGKQAPAVKGQMSWQAALQQLLAGSGLQLRVDGNTVTVLPAARAAQATTTLPTVQVTADTAANPGLPSSYQNRAARSGSKTRTPLAEVPQAVSVVNALQLQDQRAATVAEAVSYTPGVAVYPTALTDDDVILRGFGVSKDGLYRDGLRLYHNAFISRSEPYGLERVEVVRGPASVLYGRATPGGMVNMVSKQPRAGMQNEVVVEGGSDGHRQLAADIGGQLDSAGTLRYRVTALGRDSDTQWQYLPDNRRYLAAALSWQPSDATSLLLQAQYQHDENGWAVPNQLVKPGSAGQPDASINLQGPDTLHDKKGSMLGYQFSHAFSPALTLRQNVRYLDGDNTRREVRPLALAADGRTLSRRAWYRLNQETSLAADTQLESRLQHGDVQHTLLAGVDWRRSTFRQPTYRGAANAVNIFNPAFTVPAWQKLPLLWDDKDTSRQLGLYLQDQIKLGERWAFTAGLRHDKVRDTNEQVAAKLTTTDRSSATTGRLGVVYLAANGLAPYLSYSTSFQAISGNDAYGQRMKPEQGEQWEAGVRYQPEDSDTTLAASVYQLLRDNVTTTAPAPFSGSVQTGQVRARGVELEASLRLARQWDVLAALSHTDTAITRSNKANEVGRRVEMVPDWQAALWAKYRFAGALQGTSSAVGVRHAAASQGGGSSLNDAYTLVDAMLAWENRSWRAALNVSNVFDQHYLTLCDGTFCAPGFGRAMKASLAYRW